MRIDTLSQVAQIYGLNKANKTGNVAKTTGARDEVHISQAGRDYQVAKQAVAAASDIREDKVATLKTSIESGNYSVDAGDFASKLLEKYQAAQ
ncbi:MAG: flagellar biosynthesis anti-sigma factor FlgM [Lachnospiraceae bacterium]|nr:flagellar biosynthesis anti-sigma factor FlgM [Lachnospiraceae bacterium]